MNTWWWLAIIVFVFIAGVAWRNDKCVWDSTRKEYLKNMKLHLKNLQDQVPGNSGHAKHIKDAVEAGRISYEYLGTTAEELDRLGYTLDYKQRSLNALDSLRRGTHDYKECIVRLSKHIKEANLTLADIGSSDAEFASFEEANKKILARYYLGRFRGEKRVISNAAQWILRFRDEGVADNDLGLTEKEISALPVIANLA